MPNDDSNSPNIVGWIESSVLLGGVLVAAIATSAVSLYRIDSIEDKVDDLVTAISSMNVLQSEIANLKQRDLQTQKIFDKFTDSVDRLSVTLAKLEGRVESMTERNNGEERSN